MMRCGSWKESAASLRWKIEPFIDGDYRPSKSTEEFETLNPATETALSRAAVGHPEDVDAAVRVARERFNEGCWSERPPAHRAQILLKLADLIVAHKAELALLDSLEMGKPITHALHDAEQLAPRLLRSWAGFADKLMGESAPLVGGTVAFNTYEPRGVIGAITPWNFPTVNAVFKLAPVLAAGNTMVLKPSEVSPSSALKLAELALEAGVPPGVLNVVPGLGSTVGTALALHAGVDMVSFTGSTATGRKIMECCGRSNGKPLVLECGGKSPHVVFDDLESFDAVVEAAVQGIVRNQGQVCAARTRLLVHEDLKDHLLKQIVSRASQYRPADPLEETTTFGPLATPAQRDRVKRFIDQGLQCGAHTVLKGSIQTSHGCYVSPTIFDRVDRTMAIVREEIFGPVLCVQSFRTEPEAIALANDTEYGLGATVWTRDLGRGQRLAHAIRAGHVSVRTGGAEGADSGCSLSHEPQKASGFGAEVGLHGLRSYSVLKRITVSGA
jgi:acyl-CoA reductase-like NAD-dependent aldehyde dehydrogenase